VSRPKQVFAAPAPLDGESPWIDEAQARIPLEYWSLLLEFAETLDAQAAARLTALSGTAFPSDQWPAAEDRAFLARVLDALEQAPPLVAEPDDEYPEAYPNAEIARMGGAALAAFDASLSAGAPLRAWDE
jgi:hypothetical protein